jgi:hypothetical protein
MFKVLFPEVTPAHIEIEYRFNFSPPALEVQLFRRAGLENCELNNTLVFIFTKTENSLQKKTTDWQ